MVSRDELGNKPPAPGTRAAFRRAKVVCSLEWTVSGRTTWLCAPAKRDWRSSVRQGRSVLLEVLAATRMKAFSRRVPEWRSFLDVRQGGASFCRTGPRAAHGTTPYSTVANQTSRPRRDAKARQQESQRAAVLGDTRDRESIAAFSRCLCSVLRFQSGR
jgi:hypothetical protein